MGKMIRGYVQERSGWMITYPVMLFSCYLIFWLSEVELKVVRYAFLLSRIFICFCVASDFNKYRKKMAKETELEDELRRLQEAESKARIAEQEMQDYYGMWVHQIKTPIAALKVLLQAAETAEDMEEEQLRARFREMKLELFKIDQYADMVLTYVRMEHMSGDLSIERCSVDDIIRQAVKKYSQMFIYQKLKLNYEPLNLTVLTDRKWFTFVLEQILSNALKYTSQGEIRIYREDEWLVIQDTGIGIYAEDLPRIFERGFTGYNGRSDKKSSGIGLYLCKQILDKLGCEVHVESEVGVGTKVKIQMERESFRIE